MSSSITNLLAYLREQFPNGPGDAAGMVQYVAQELGEPVPSGHYRNRLLHLCRLCGMPGADGTPYNGPPPLPPSLQIRLATPRDLQSIKDIEDEVSAETGSGAYNKDVIRTMMKHTDVLVLDNSIVGFCMHHMLDQSTMKKMARVGIHFNTGRKAHVLQVTNIAIRKKWRGRGFGKRLVRKAMEKHPKHKYVRYACTDELTHCIEKVLRCEEGYTQCDPKVEEGVYENGKSSMRFVFSKPK